ncbi:PBP1A family penicillin-binding protein [Brucepastera parasyntrophica]|uniref:penicillin-binding protein 1A n=1 Tax=Brucepastera parasyntrophica TaxID=2880008 RepID=UPI00210D53C5|nr:PBP1A family penicillin-binding protein [Brucepastera parasyntrophica]ULQ59462.1 PBP1A family penicillin-binding protein [Brucepastera parasyntrophica]
MLGFALAKTTNLKNSENFTDFNPDLPTKILDIRGDLITEFASEEKREMITLEELPPHMINALITREDQIFYKHKGYSIKAIARAVYGKLTGRSLGGGSTITQQIAGTLYCDRAERSLTRKVKELWWALQMERRYSKNEILELYLNKMYFGGGTYGVNAASRFYFGHSATEITPAEAAILVIQLSNPSFYNPFDHPNRAMDRQREVLRQMVQLGYLEREEAENSFDEYWANFDYTRTSSSAWLTRDDKARWFSEYVRRQLVDTMMYGTMDIYSGGYTVHTTLDLNHQAAADQVMQRHITLANNRFQRSSSTHFTKSDQYAQITELIALTFNLPSLAVSAERIQVKSAAQYRSKINPVVDMMTLVFGLDSLKTTTNKVNAKTQQAAARTTIEGTLITLENDTGYITALVGGSKFDQSNQIIRATQAYVQPGSTFKPLYYSAAIDSRKFTASSVINDTPVVFYNEDKIPYTPLNFKGEWKGTVLFWEALAQSLNVPSLRILDGIGFDAAINRAAALLGYTNKATIERVFPRVHSIGLGVISVAPIQIARAYSTLANQGKEVTPIAIRSIEDRNGRTIIDPEKELRLEQKRKGNNIQIVSPQNAYIMNDLLKNTIRTGTLAWASGFTQKLTFRDKDTGRTFVMPAAGKTGTTQNWADAWAVGYTPYFTTVIWFGFDQPGFSLGLDNTGATLSGVAWGDYMGLIHDGLPYRDFVKPQTGLVQATVCRKSGMLVTENCSNGSIQLYYLEGTQPTSYCEYHELNLELKQLAVSRLETETFIVGQRPATTDTSALMLDPDIFVDPAPSQAAQRRANQLNRNNRRPQAQSEVPDAGNQETVPQPPEEFIIETAFSGENVEQIPAESDIFITETDIIDDNEDEAVSEPAFNPLLE